MGVVHIWHFKTRSSSCLYSYALVYFWITFTWISLFNSFVAISDWSYLC